ncbi:MAG: ABC transporter permease [Saprospiraceae bacterium]
MNNLWLIIQREYLTRVKRRSFILATLLTPLAIGLFFVIVSLIFQYNSDDAKRIAVIDQGHIFEGKIKDENNLFFKFVDTDLEVLKDNFDEMEYNGILVIPALADLLKKDFKIFYYSDEKLTLDIEPIILSRIRDRVREYKIDQLEIDRQQLEALNTKIELEPRPIKASAEETTKLTGKIAAAIGFFMGIIMYMTVFIYGMMVMRSVMEEKTNRIVEVMISSVKPFQLMLGKIIGVGAVGLTQLAIWAILIPLIVTVAGFFFAPDAPTAMPPSAAAAGANIDPEEAEAMLSLVIQELSQQNWWVILPLFLLYFLGGYFMYSALFAAVGSAMGDDLGEGQALTIPITIPVLLAFYIMMVSVQAPHSSLAVWSSIFPLFSPIVMPARIPFDPPAWQILLSLVLLIATALALVWLSGRIYRVGILMYGKKVTFKELGKWMFRG